MRYILTSLILIIIMVYQFKKNRFVLAATVVYPIMWVLALLGLLFTDKYYVVSLGTLIIIVLGYLFFCFSFDFANNKNKTRSIFLNTFNDGTVNQIGLTVAFYLAVAVGLAYFVLVRRYISFSTITTSFLQLVGNKASGIVTIPTFLIYLSGITSTTLKIFLLLYFRNSYNEYQKSNQKQFHMGIRCIILFALSALILITNFSRNALLNFLLPIFFIFVISKRISNKKIVVFGAVLFTIFVGIFVWFSFFRDSYLYNGNNFSEITINRFVMYLSGGVVAFDQACSKLLNWLCLNSGVHTFSFITSVIDAVFSTSITPGVVLDSIFIGPSSATNVYTVYYWTALDMGIVYSLLFQIVYGYVYGSLYRKTRMGKLRDTYWYCTLSYPLVMMFFEDQYTSISQTWLVRIFIYVFIATICNISRFKISNKNAVRR